MTPLTPDVVRRLAADSLPALFFSDREAFYPVRAESWLTHATSAPWSADPDDVAGLAPDPHRRGTAIMRSGPGVSDATHLGGPPNAGDEPVRLEASGDPSAIGNAAYAGQPDPAAEVFLSFAGWADPAPPAKGGDLGYLQAAFSELASAINHDVPWEPIATRPNRPFFGHPPPASPAVYCEVDWAGAHFRDAPPAEGITATALDGFIQVTYYFLFPARTALAGQPNVKPLEGQWAAISLFYRAAGNLELLDENNRPVEVELGREPKPIWVVMSLDPESFDSRVLRFGAPDTQVVAPPETGAAHVAAWVGAGTHRFFPGQSAEVPMDPGDPWPHLDYEPGSDMEGIFPAVFPGMMGQSVGGPLDVISTLLAGGPIWWFLAWLINLFTELWDDDASTADIPRSADTPIEPGGPVGSPNYGEAAPPSPGAPAPDGFATNEGSLEGWDVAYFDMKVISRIKSASEPDLEPPPWWGYTGRWGIKVPPESGWEQGTRRTDAKGRSWAYWMATRLFDRLVKESPSPGAP